jgi:hypothetical protein
MFEADDINMFSDAEFNDMLKLMDDNMATTHHLSFDLDFIFLQSEASSTHRSETISRDNEGLFPRPGLVDLLDELEEPQKQEEECIELLGGYAQNLGKVVELPHPSSISDKRGEDIIGWTALSITQVSTWFANAWRQYRSGHASHVETSVARFPSGVSAQTQGEAWTSYVSTSSLEEPPSRK